MAWHNLGYGRGIIDLRGTHLGSKFLQSAEKARINLRRATAKYLSEGLML
jgi:hypothetical protein